MIPEKTSAYLLSLLAFLLLLILSIMTLGGNIGGGFAVAGSGSRGPGVLLVLTAVLRELRQLQFRQAEGQQCQLSVERVFLSTLAYDVNLDFAEPVSPPGKGFGFPLAPLSASDTPIFRLRGSEHYQQALLRMR